MESLLSFGWRAEMRADGSSISRMAEFRPEPSDSQKHCAFRAALADSASQTEWRSEDRQSHVHRRFWTEIRLIC